MAIEPYKTSDTPFAAFLYYNGHVLITIKPDEKVQGRKIFIFVLRDDTIDLEHRYYFGKPEKPLVEPQKFYKAERFLVKKLKETK